MRPGYSLCICPDGRLLNNQISDMLARFAQPEPWQREVAWGDEGLDAAFWEALTLQGLIETPRALVVRNANLLPAEIWKRLSRALARPLGKTWLFLCLEGGWEKGQPKIAAHISKLKLFEHARKQDWLWQSPGIDARSLKAYLTAQAKQRQLHFEPGALEALCRVLPLDAAAIDNELGKIALYVEDGKIDSKAAMLVEHSPAFDIFSLLRHMQAGRSLAVWQQVLGEEHQQEDMVFPLAGLLLREARILWQLKAGEKPYLHPQDAQAKRELASRMGFTSLARLWELALSAEYAIKSGQYNPEQALHALIAGLGQVFKSK